MTASPAQILQRFRKEFHQSPRMFFSPGRINLIGEHIDYNDGFVMPAAINLGIWFALAPNQTGSIRIYSQDMDAWLLTSPDKIEKKAGWENYLLGVMDQLQKKGFALQGFDCVFGGNIPAGAGLSSSAAVECGLAYALNCVFSYGISRLDIALIAQKAEHSFPGVQCGIMDQFANMMGEAQQVILLDCMTLKHETLPLVLEAEAMILVNTKVHHSLAAGEYNLRRSQCEQGLQILKQQFPGVATFRDITPGQVSQAAGLLGEKIFQRCLYVTGEIERTRKAAVYLKAHNLPAFGKLMYASHEGLSKLYEVSCPELDFLVGEAIKNTGVLGARMMGGGFGGCTINLVRKDALEDFISDLTAAYQRTFGILPEVYRVITSGGTHELPGSV